MLVRVYRDGEARAGRSYALPPHEAAIEYCREACRFGDGGADLIVEPLDTEARDMAGWHDDGDGPVFRMFKARAVIMWEATEVDTLNPFMARARP